MSGGATGEILQEYLVKLGYSTDTISLKKFEDGLGKTGKSVLRLGTGVAGVIASVEAASAAFAYSMRKSFFAAELAGSSVKTMQSMSYAGKQFGISGDAMASSIKGMAQALRMNPGLQGLVESFGVKVTGRDKGEVMLDFVKAIKEMPESIGSQYASLFGMDPDTFHQVREHYDEIISKKQELEQMQKLSGLDMDAQKKNILEYTAAMDKLSARFDIFASTFLSSMSPVFKQTIEWLDYIIEGWTWAFSSESEKKAATKAMKAERSLKGATEGEGTARPPVAKPVMTPEEFAEYHKKKFGVAPAELPALPPQKRAQGSAATPTTTPTPTPTPSAAVVPPAAPAKGVASLNPRTSFIKSVASQLNVPEEAIAAQLQLETGANGDKTIGAFNYGNIKAGKKWKGAVGVANAVEYDAQGKSQYERSKFRSYSSPEESAKDYAEFIKSKFSGAVGAKSAKEYAQALKSGGYATDPQYVDKITGIASKLGADKGKTVVTQTNTTTIHVTGQNSTDIAKAVGQQQDRVYSSSLRQMEVAMR